MCLYAATVLQLFFLSLFFSVFFSVLITRHEIYVYPQIASLSLNLFGFYLASFHSLSREFLLPIFIAKKKANRVVHQFLDQHQCLDDVWL